MESLFFKKKYATEFAQFLKEIGCDSTKAQDFEWLFASRPSLHQLVNSINKEKNVLTFEEFYQY